MEVPVLSAKIMAKNGKKNLALKKGDEERETATTKKRNYDFRGKFLYGVNKGHSEPCRVLLNTETDDTHGLGVDWATKICRIQMILALDFQMLL